MGYDIEMTERDPQPAAIVRGHADENGIPDFLGHAFGAVVGVLAEQGLEPAGAPFGCYTQTADGAFDIEAGFPASGRVRSVGDVESHDLPGGRYARTMHVGDWGELDAAYTALLDWAAEHGYEPSAPPWESYLDGPEVAKPRTEVFLPCTSAPRADG